MKVPVIAAVLSLCAASGLRAAPFSELWRVTGVTVSDGGYSVTLRWPAAAYQHQFPGYRAIEWKAGADIRLEPEVVISCRVPSFATDGTPLAAELRLPRHPDAKNRQEAEEAVREIAEIASEKGPLVGLIAALAMAGRSERTPVRVGLGGGGAEFSSLLVLFRTRRRVGVPAERGGPGSPSGRWPAPRPPAGAGSSPHGSRLCCSEQPPASNPDGPQNSGPNCKTSIPM